MTLNNLYYQFQQSSTLTKLIIGALGLIWTLVLVALLGLGILMFASPSQALQPTPGVGAPTIVLEPATGSAGSSVTVRGEGWAPGSMVLLYLSSGSETQNYALASALADTQGHFATNLIIPFDSQWAIPGTATVIAKTQDNIASAQATLNIAGETNPPSVTPALTLTPTLTSTPGSSPTPTATPQPGAPLAATMADLNVRGGPGTGYPILGLLKAGQTAEITGRSADGGWWQIKFSGVAGERGWLSAQYVSAQNTANVPVVQAPPLPTTIPATATPIPPTATPVVITDWRGEYYSNPNLNGTPVLVRNDVVVSFNWGGGAPAAGLPTDNFSARWTRTLNFPSGIYRFALTIDDGVRVWVDNNLVIDQWHDGSPTTYVAEARLSEGKHRIRIEYYERSGGALIDLRWQRVDEQSNQAPRPNAGGPYVVDEGSQVVLDGSKSTDPDGTIVKYEWDFNFDGRTFTTDATGKNPAAFYADGPIILTVALRVTDDKGDKQVAVSQVTVLSLAPRAEAGGPYAGQVGNPITLAGAANDPSPVDQNSLYYRWEFGDGTAADGLVMSHSYGRAGNYIARLIVTDKDGAQIADTATVQVSSNNQAPAAVISGPTTGKTGQPLNFSGSNSRDNDGTINAYTWNFGDGVTANGMNVSHSYGQVGTYEVTLTVTDNGGATGSSTFIVQISDAIKTPPVAAINGPANGVVSQPLSFDGTGSKDSDGQITSYTWDFGDGTSANGFNVSHTYAVSGTYKVTLTVIDNDGLNAQATQVVVIEEPVQVQLPPNVVLNAPEIGVVGQSLTFDASGSNDPDGQIANYSWSFGDGVVENSSLPVIPHSYTQTGVYTITLTLTDNDGLINTTTHLTTIN